MAAAARWESTVMWYGGLGLLTAQVARSIALPRKYYPLVVREIEIMGVRSLGVAAVAAIFTGMVFALQSAVNMARFRSCASSVPSSPRSSSAARWPPASPPSSAR